MNNHKIELVPVTSGNKKITLNECKYYKYDISNAKWILDTNDAYYVYVDGINSDLKLYVYPEPTTISKVYNMFPEQFFSSSSETTFKLRVNYVVNIEKCSFYFSGWI